MGVFVKGVVVAATLTTLTVGGVVVAWRFGSLGDMRVKALSMLRRAQTAEELMNLLHLCLEGMPCCRSVGGV
jgi:hypothetical protein